MTFSSQLTDIEEFVGIIDLGSNSARLMIAHLEPGKTPAVVLQVKFMVRLGENSFESKQLQEPAILRTIDVLKSFAETCKQYNVTSIQAIATAAVRRADNGKDFVQRVLKETGIQLNVVSGHEEARLIYLGVSSGLPHTFGLRIFIDIGGGSTELIVGHSLEYLFLDSLSLGCVMLTNRFMSENKGKVRPQEFEKMKEYVRQTSAHAFQSLVEYNLVEVVASSGTAIALLELSQKLDLPVKPSSDPNVLSLESLREVSRYVCTLTSEERENLPGLSNRRAEVLVAGSAILLTLLEQLGLKKITISHQNLQHGALADYIKNKQLPIHKSRKNTRKQSVEFLAQAFHYEKKHSEHVKALALMLHDSAVDSGLISYNERWREYLNYAAILHDIGISISYTKHYAHSYYIISHSELLGFTEEEKEYIALLTFFQNKKPSRKYDIFNVLSEEIKEQITLYSSFLAIAESMEKLHRQHIYEAAFHDEGKELILYAQQFSPSLIEENAVRAMQKTVEKVFNRKLSILFST